ncbi:porin [Ursidibacter sp. B-7004-1]
MKKAILALSAGVFATSSANAYTFVDNKETGTKLEFSGSARLLWNSTANKTEANGVTTREHINHAVSNNGSRFGFKITQDLTNDFYALGRVEWRFRGTADSQHNFDDIYTRQLYAGFGHKKYGELTYGHHTVFTDNIKQTDLPNTLSLSDGLLIGSARKVAQYTYSGIEGLKLGVFYGANSKRNNSGLDLANHRKDVWGAGAVYSHKFDDTQSVKVATGVTRERSRNSNGSTYSNTAYALGTAYTFDKTTIGLDLERRTIHNQGLSGNKRLNKEVRTVIYQKLMDNWNAYTMYAYKTDKSDRVLGNDTKSKKHQYMLGTEYYFVPKHLKGFVEWQTTRTHNYTNGIKSSKVRDNVTAIGLRAYW